MSSSLNPNALYIPIDPKPHEHKMNTLEHLICPVCSCYLVKDSYSKDYFRCPNLTPLHRNHKDLPIKANYHHFYKNPIASYIFYNQLKIESGSLTTQATAFDKNSLKETIVFNSTNLNFEQLQSLFLSLNSIVNELPAL
jgi:hypothetical protein